MKKNIYFLYLFVLAIIFITGCSNQIGTANAAKVSTAFIPVTVLKHVDGDTIHVKMPDGKNETIRMLLIDTPETHKPNTPVEPFGPEASNYAASVMPIGKHIYLEEGVKGHNRDKYGRLLAFIYLSKTDMYNEDVVKKGLARVAYVIPPNTQHLSEMEKIQNIAKSKHLGIWSLNGYVTNKGFNLSFVRKTSSSNNSTSGCSIKGNINSKGEKIYHVKGDLWYDKTKAEQMFCSVQDAQKAGFRAPK